MKTIKNKAVYEQDINGFKGKANSIVFPDTITEMQNLVKLSKLDIIPRGSGTSFTGSCVPNNSVIVDLSKMNKIIEINPSRKMVLVEAGVLLSDLNQELEKYDLEFPTRPLFSEIQTIGGTIATNAAGSRELKYGKTRNWIESLDVINGKGELIELSKTDASDFAGMEGTTGIIVRAKLRLTQKKTRTFSILKSDSFEEVLSLNNELKLDHEVSMIGLFGKKLSLMLGLEKKYHLFVEYESDKGSMKGAFYQKFLKMKDKAYYTLASNGFTLLENPKFFANHIKDFIDYLEQADIPYFSNLGSGVVYVCFNPELPEKHKETLDLIKRLRAKFSYELGIGLTKKEFLDSNEQEIIKRIKIRRDPDWKFNRDKMIDYKIETQETKVSEKTPTQKSQTPEQKIQEFIEQEKQKEVIETQPDPKEDKDGI